MGTIRCVLVLLTLVPAVASGQSLEVFGAGGPTITDAGHSLAVGAGFRPHPRLMLLFDFERTELSSRTMRDASGRVLSSFRGGTLFLGAGELRVLPFGRGRVGPYGLAGAAAGVSRPTVNAMYPDRVTNQVRAMFIGGGIHIPLGERMSVFTDARMMVGAEGIEGIVAVAPLRAGMTWRF